MKIAIVIPARWGSTRFPGKPLAMIAGRTMLERVTDVAKQAADVDVIVTTEDQRIADHATSLGIECIMTPAECPTGSDRVLAALKKAKRHYDFVINLQGDAPFTPPAVITALIDAWQKNPDLEVVTPVHRLSWAALDRLREAKKITPFSGTTALVDINGRALWFSKGILPIMRQEDRATEPSPVLQHIGLYGFKTATLEKFCALPQGTYEKLAGLEQLRLLENGIPIQTVIVEMQDGTIQTGIDSPEDIKRAEAMLAERGAA